MKIFLAQLNPFVGDIHGNGEKIMNACREANTNNSSLLVTPELSLLGYPPRDLLLKPKFIQEQNQTLELLAKKIFLEAPRLSVLIGIAEPTKNLEIPNLFNSIALIEKGSWSIIARKQLLPTYDVFDENRYFKASVGPGILNLNHGDKEWKVGITICEDLWVEESIQKGRISGPDPIEELIPMDINLLINISASPFSHKKDNLRQILAQKAIKRLGCPMIYLNQVGGNDELIFDGESFVMNEKGKVILSLPPCKEASKLWDTDSIQTNQIIKKTSYHEKLFHALVIGLRDYIEKCGFNSILIGLSGGIDSALVTVIACAALGPDKVNTILLPSCWSSKGSIDDSLELIEKLRIKTRIISIEDLMESFDNALVGALTKKPEGLTAENLQSRIRGTILMAISNAEGHLLLSTGNKSELAVGYCTLYGDMNGGLAVIGDLYKTCIFELCKWIDESLEDDARKSFNLPINTEIIGKAIRSKAPSAELRKDQIDSDSLPNYELLDPILKGFIEERLDAKDLIDKGYESSLVAKIQSLLKQAEFKRRQAAPVLKVSNQAFGTGWRLPIAAK